MPRIQILSYSKFYHAGTDTQFHPVLDRRTGCYVGIAEVDEATAETLGNHAAFQVLAGDEFAQMTEQPADPEPEPSHTGDPLIDQVPAADPNDLGEPIDLNGPPAPASK